MSAFGLVPLPDLQHTQKSFQEVAATGSHTTLKKRSDVRILTPSEQTEAPDTLTGVTEGRHKKGVQIERFYKEPEEVGHHAVVTEDHRGLTGQLRRRHRQRHMIVWDI